MSRIGWQTEKAAGKEDRPTIILDGHLLRADSLSLDLKQDLEEVPPWATTPPWSPTVQYRVGPLGYCCTVEWTVDGCSYRHDAGWSALGSKVDRQEQEGGGVAYRVTTATDRPPYEPKAARPKAVIEGRPRE